MLRGQSPLRSAALITSLFLIAACSDNGRDPLLSGVDTIDIPAADVDNQQNTNIANPTLNIPVTYEVAPGDMLTLVWSDEFDGATLDPEVWFFETGDGSQYLFGQPGRAIGWGNNELQYYLPDNAQLEDGKLVITAKRETVPGVDWWTDIDGDGNRDPGEVQTVANYTSARIHTRDRFAFQYGRIEASIKLPGGQGLWPAFWMLAQDQDEVGAFPGKGLYGVWAQTGEIDIVESVNLDAQPNEFGIGGDNEIFATIHFGGDETLRQQQSSSTEYTPSFDVTEDFHTYAVEWDEFEIRWYVDDTLYKVETNWNSTGGDYPAPFDQPFYVLFNLAVGGNFPGDPNGTTPFPATLEVDWVRVYSGEAPPEPPAAPDPIVFDDDFGAGVSFVEFGGSTNDISVDNTVMNSGTASLRVAVPASNYTGGALAVNPGRDVSSFNSLTFWARADGDHTLNVAGIGNDGNDATNATEVTALALTTAWQQYTIMIPDPSVLTANTGLFHFAEGSEEGAYTIWFDDIVYANTGGGGSSEFVNGDFEAMGGSLDGWTQSIEPPGVGSIAADSSGQGGRAGTVARLQAAGSANPFQTNDVVISQEFLGAGTVSPGDTITVEFDLYGSFAPGAAVFVEVIFLNAAGQAEGGQNFLNADPTPYTPTTTWTSYSGTVVAGTGFVPPDENNPSIPWDVSGGVTLSLKVSCGPVDGCTPDASFDNVTFSITNPG